jgi:hypothetical protein
MTRGAAAGQEERNKRCAARDGKLTYFNTNPASAEKSIGAKSPERNFG